MRISDWSSDVCSSDLLGARVSLLEMHRVLGRDDPEIVAFARRQLAADGVEIHEGIAISRVARDGNAIAVTLEKDGMTTTLTGSHLLVAAGRKASVDGLGLDAAGVAQDRKSTRLNSSH